MFPQSSVAVHDRTSVYCDGQLPSIRRCTPAPSCGLASHASAALSPVAMAGTALHSTVVLAGTPLIVGAAASCAPVSGMRMRESAGTVKMK